METNPRPSSAGFVLAGGHSSRMGTDKALALFAGCPLIQVALTSLEAAGVASQIAGSRSALSRFAPEIPDTFPECGPLGGVHAALSASHAEWTLFLPVDLPLMPASLLDCLLRRAALCGQPVTATRLNSKLEPFPVILSRSVLAPITQRLAAGSTACHRAWQTIPEELGVRLDAIDVEHLVQTGQCAHPAQLPPVFWYQSANTPADLARLNRISAKLDPQSSSRSSNLKT
jgi:molybdopterin-guanine dinucleotide biosynthesis protein A